MKKFKYLLVSIFCFLAFIAIAYAKYVGDEVKVKGVTPKYDENSSVELSYKEGMHSVTFNDKNQKAEYYVTIENTADYPVKVTNIEFSNHSEDFLVYRVEGLSKDSILKSKETKEITIYLETITTKNWGHNFNEDLEAIVYFEKTELKSEEDVPKNEIINDLNDGKDERINDSNTVKNEIIDNEPTTDSNTTKEETTIVKPSTGSNTNKNQVNSSKEEKEDNVSDDKELGQYENIVQTESIKFIY